MIEKVSRRTANKLLVAIPAIALAPGLSSAASSATGSNISAADPHPRRRVRVPDYDVDDQPVSIEMSYVDTGHGDPIVFLHGNAQYSYVWRNVIPYLTAHGRCLAPDLVGMGQSGRSPRKAYRFVEHVRYLDAWFDALGLTRNVILVGHDWGAPLGFYRALRYPKQIQGIAYLEGPVRPLRWKDFDGREAIFRALRSEKGEHMVLDENFFVEVALPRGVIRKLSDAEMAAYRAPYPDRESRLPTLVWPRELPIEGEPADVVAIVERYGEWLSRSALPKLFIDGDPGTALAGRAREFCRTWPSQREVTVKGLHVLQEDSPAEIGVALQEFVKRVRG